MKIYLLFKIFCLFLLLLLLELILSFGFTKFFFSKDQSIQTVVFLCIDFAHIIVILIMIKIWGINIFKLFKKIKISHFLYALAIGTLIMLIYPMESILVLIDSFSSNKTGIMMPIEDVFNQNGIGIYYVIRTLLIMPILEEILYRGIIQNTLNEKFSTMWAIVISSAFFAIGHMDFQQSITVFFTSLILGYVYHKSKNLTIVVLLHSFVNLGFLFFRIEYQEEINYSVLFYHFSLIVLLIFIAKMYPKMPRYGN